MPAHFSILLIDDDPDILPILERAAEHSFPEARFTQVSSLDELDQYLARRPSPPSLVLLDIDLNRPEDGFAVLAWLRSRPQGFLLPIVMLTRSTAPTHVSKAYEMGISTFTTKPDSLAGWKDYLAILKGYWQQIVAFPGMEETEPPERGR